LIVKPIALLVGSLSSAQIRTQVFWALVGVAEEDVIGEPFIVSDGQLRLH
jgi:hypothetical protein